MNNYLSIEFIFLGKPTAIVKPCNKSLTPENEIKDEMISDLKIENTKNFDIAQSETSETLPKEVEKHFEMKTSMNSEVENIEANLSEQSQKEMLLNKSALEEYTTPSKEKMEDNKGMKLYLHDNICFKL